MTGSTLPDGDHVVRYVRPRKVRDGRADGSAFWLRAGEDALSVNWLETFSPDTEKRIAAVREVIRLQISRTGASPNFRWGKSLTRWLERRKWLSDTDLSMRTGSGRRIRRTPR